MASTMTVARPDNAPSPAARHCSLRAVVLLTHHTDTPPDAAGALASFQSGIIPEDVLVVVLLQHGGSSTSGPRHAMVAWAIDHGQEDGSAVASAPLVDWRDLDDAWVHRHVLCSSKRLLLFQGALAQTATQLIHTLNATLDPAVTLVLIEPPPALHDHLPAVHACRRVDTHPSAHSANLVAYLTHTLSPLDRRALQQLFIDVMPTLDAVSEAQPLMSRHADVQLLGSAADPTSRARLQLLITHLVREHVLVPYATTIGELPRVHAQSGILYLVDHGRYQSVGQALAHGEMLPSLTKPRESIPLPFRPIRPHCATCTCLRVLPPSPPASTHTTYAQLLFQLVADPDPPPDFECREDPDTGEFTYRVHVRGSIMYGNAHRDRDAARESAARAALVQLGVIDSDVGVGPLPSVVHRPLSSPTDGATCSTEMRMPPPPISTDGPGAVATHATGGLGGGYGWSAGGSPHAAALEPPTPIHDVRDYPARNAAKVILLHPSSPKFAREATAGLETAKASSSPTGTTANDAAVHRTGFATGATWSGSGHTSSSVGRAVSAPRDRSGSSWARIPGAGLVTTHQMGPPPRAAWSQMANAPVPTMDTTTMARSRAASMAPPLSSPESARPSASSGWGWRAVVPHPTPPAPPTRHVPSHVTGPAAPCQTPTRVAYHATTDPSVPRATHPVATHATGPAAFHTTSPPPPPPVLASLATPAPTNSDPTPPLPPADRIDFAPLIQFHHADIAGGNYFSKLVEYLQKAKLPPDTVKYTFTTNGEPAGPTGPVQYGATLLLFGHQFSVPVQYRRKQDAKNQVARRAMEELNMILD